MNLKFSLSLNVRKHFKNVTSEGRLFQVLAAASRNAWSPIVESRVSGKFYPKFRCLGNGGQSGENAIGSIQWPIPENSPIGAKISQRRFFHITECRGFSSNNGSGVLVGGAK